MEHTELGTSKNKIKICRHAENYNCKFLFLRFQFAFQIFIEILSKTLWNSKTFIRTVEGSFRWCSLKFDIFDSINFVFFCEKHFFLSLSNAYYSTNNIFSLPPKRMSIPITSFHQHYLLFFFLNTADHVYEFNIKIVEVQMSASTLWVLFWIFYYYVLLHI